MSFCNLCGDLISEIFERLPPKSLVRFRCLSKSWFSRISSRKFINKHTLQSPHRCIVRHLFDNKNEDSEDIYSFNWHGGLPCPRVAPRYITSVKFPIGPNGPTEVIGSCNGILCLYDRNEDFQVHFYLWNLSIRRKLTLSYHPFFTDSIENDLDVISEFGFDQINDDYKILLISYSEYGAAEKTFLYSMKTDSWSEIASPTITYLDVKSPAIFFNGVLHWLIKYNLIEHMIMTFDLTSNVFGSISLPKPSCETHAFGLYNNLYVSWIEGDKSWLWRMNEYNNVDVATWSLVSKYDTKYDNTNESNSQSEKACSCEIIGYMYVQSLELLDKGIACGETFICL